MTTILPATTPLRGTLRVPGDKSICHRAVMLGGVCAGETLITGFSGGDDNLSTVTVLRALGVSIDVDHDGRAVRVHGAGPNGLRRPDAPMDCGNSGTTMRLMTGLLAGLGIEATLIGDASLSRRPMERIARPLRVLGARVATAEGGCPPVRIHAGLSGQLDLPRIDLTVASAQVKSAILLAALLAGRSVRVSEPHPSRDHTESMLRGLGVPVRSSQHYRHPQTPGRAWVELSPVELPLLAGRIAVPGDISSAAFLLAAAAVVPDSDIKIPGCGVAPTRAGILEAFELAQIPVELTTTSTDDGSEPVADLRARSGGTAPIRITPQIVPRLVDEIPVLAVVCGRLPGRSTFEGVGELRVKESDRLGLTAALLRRCGRGAQIQGDSLHIEGDPSAPFSSFEFDAHGDHRMAAAAIVASMGASGPCQVSGVECLGVSYPGFLRDLETLRGG